MKISMKSSSHTSTILLKFALFVIFVAGCVGTGIYFYNKHQESVQKELALRLEQERKLEEERLRLEKEQEESRQRLILEQKKLEQEALRQKLLDDEKRKLALLEHARLKKEAEEKAKIEEEEKQKKQAKENRKLYLNNVSTSAFDIQSSLVAVFPKDGKTDRNTYDKMSPILFEYNTFITSLQSDQEAFALETVIELVNYVQINQNVIAEAKKKNDSWDAYIAGLNSPERKKQEEQSKKIGKELAAKSAADLAKRLKERKQARERQLSIWAAAGGGKSITLGDGK